MFIYAKRIKFMCSKSMYCKSYDKYIWQFKLSSNLDSSIETIPILFWVHNLKKAEMWYDEWAWNNKRYEKAI